MPNATTPYMPIISRMHSAPAGPKFRYSKHAANSMGNLFICWLYVSQKNLGERRRCDQGRCKTPAPRAEVVERRQKPLAGARRRRDRESARRRPRGGGAKVGTDWGWFALVSAGATGAWRGGGLFRGGRRRERQECVRYDEYAYIRAKRGRRRSRFARSAETRPCARKTHISRRRSFGRRGSFGRRRLAGARVWRAGPRPYVCVALSYSRAGSEPSVSVHVAKARIELR